MSSRTLNVSAGALALALLTAAAAAAQVGRIGLVDTRRLLTQSADGKEIIARLDKLAEEKSVLLKPKQDEIQALRKRIADGQVSLSDDKIADLKHELEEKLTAGKRLQEDLQKEMEQAQATAFGEFERKLAPLIEQFGREQGFAFIFNIGFFNQPNLPSGIVWVDASADITDELIRRIDAAGAATPKP